MTKPLSSFREGKERKAVAHRRVKSGSGGLGFLSAQDFLSITKDEPDTELVEVEEVEVHE